MTPEITALLGVILGGGFVSGIAAFRKAGAESSSAATQSLIAVNEELRRELSRRDAELAKLRERLAILEQKVG